MGYYGDFWNAGKGFRDVFGYFSMERYRKLLGWNRLEIWVYGGCIRVYEDVWDMVYVMVYMWVVVGWIGWLCDDIG